MHELIVFIYGYVRGASFAADTSYRSLAWWSMLTAMHLLCVNCFEKFMRKAGLLAQSFDIAEYRDVLSRGIDV